MWNCTSIRTPILHYHGSASRPLASSSSAARPGPSGSPIEWAGRRPPRTSSSAIGNGSHGSTGPDGAAYQEARGNKWRLSTANGEQSTSGSRLQGSDAGADSTDSKHFTGTHTKGPATKPPRSPIFSARELYNGRVRRGFHRRLDFG